MKILEDFKEILYDILGFVLPGMFAMIIFIPMMIFSNNETWSSFIIKAFKGLIEKLQLGIEIEEINGIIEIITNESFANFLSQNKILITVLFIAMAYMFGCAVHFGAKKYYKMMYLIMDMIGLAETDEYDKAQVTLLANERKNNKFLESALENKSSFKRVESIIRYTLRRNDNSSLVGKYIGKYNFFMSFSFLFLMLSMFFIERNLGWILVGGFLLLHIALRVFLKFIDLKINDCKRQLKNLKNVRLMGVRLTECMKLINKRYEKKLKLFKLLKTIKVFVLLMFVVVFKQYCMFIGSYIIHLGLNSEYIRHYGLSKKEAFLGMADYLSK